MVSKKQDIKKKYNLSAVSYNKRYAPIQFKKFTILNNLKLSGKILDLGGGSGLLSEYLKNNNLINLDISFNMLKQSKERNICGDLDYLPLKTNCFDAIISFTAIQNLPNFKLVFEEIARVLKKKGKIICSILNKNLNLAKITAKINAAGLIIKNKTKCGEDIQFIIEKSI